MPTPVIEVVNMSIHLGSHVVLENVNLTVYQNDFLGVVGPNGGGKTTLLKALLGLLEPSEGEVRVLGKKPALSRRRVGYVPQYGEFDRQFPASVWDVVLLGRLPYAGIFCNFSQNDRYQVQIALEKAGIWELKNAPAGSLSGGQRQRMLIARALVAEPSLLFLDEPAAFVDARAEQDLYALLKELNRQITILLVTHDIGVISSHVTRIACVNRKLFCHEGNELGAATLENLYGCPVDLLAHGAPHRVLKEHSD
jgi:zinc transport system ATP-binding protein